MAEKQQHRKMRSWREGKSSTARGYNSRWRKARDTFLSRHPLCVYCQKQGYVTAATVVDHIQPHRGDSALFWDSSNWQSLCSSCHSRHKQREEQGGKRFTPIGLDGYPID